MTGKKKILSPYYVVTVIILAFLAVFFLFPLYWIVTGSVKEKSDIIIKSDSYYCFLGQLCKAV